MTVHTIKDCTCDRWHPDRPCPYHERKALELMYQDSITRDYDPELARVQEQERIDIGVNHSTTS